MNTKILARIAAAAISATMLSTACFAAPIAKDELLAKDDAATTAAINFVIESDDISKSEEAMITMMAYLVDGTVTVDNVPAYVDEDTTPMIALDQTVGETGFGSVPLDYAKLAEGKKIVVKLGGSDSTVDTYLVAYDKEVGGVTVTHIIGDVNGDGAVNAVDRDALKLYVAAKNATAKDTVNTNSNTVIGSTINKINETTTANWIVGDVNGDGAINAVDRDALKLYVAAKNATAKETVNTNSNTVIGSELEYQE